MSVSLSDRKYVPCFFLFTLILTLFFLLFLLLGTRLSPKEETSVSAPATSLPTIVIDPGHGGEDGGAVGKGDIYEKNVNLAIAQMLCDMLRANGLPTVMTRTEDILLYDPTSDHHGKKKIQDLATRRQIAESYDNAVFVSIHMNAFPDSRYGGLQVYYSKNNPDSENLAKEIQLLTKNLLLPQNDRAVKPADGSIYLLDRLECPSVLVECGVLSNPEDLANLSNPIYQKKMALSLCLAISEYLEKEASLS